MKSARHTIPSCLFALLAAACGSSSSSVPGGVGGSALTPFGSGGGGGFGNQPVGGGGFTGAGAAIGAGGISGTGASPGAGATTSSGGAGIGGSPIGVGGGMGGSGPGQVDPVGNKNRAPGYIDLSPPMGAPFDDAGTTPTAPPPTGWTWHPVDGAICRDGTPTGVYIRKGTASKLLIYLEGGGACSNDHFCAFNPKSVDQVLAGDGQTVLGSALGAIAGRQQPGIYTNNTGLQGIFDATNAADPFKDWNEVYVPYCTGDVFFGTNANATVPGAASPGPQQFVGYDDMKLIIGRTVPTFKDKVDQVVLAGASAGGFGTALNFSMVQDAFGDIPVLAIDDSGPPLDDQYMPVCMQKAWRKQWGFAGSLPPDCTECQQADGGGLIHLADFLMKKHPKASIAMISTMYDEVIRLFYTVGVNGCTSYDTADPVQITLGTPPIFSPDTYHDGLLDLRTKYQSTGRFATYFMGADAANKLVYGAHHQHIFRSEFYLAGGADTRATSYETIAQFVQNFITGKIENIGPLAP